MTYWWLRCSNEDLSSAAKGLGVASKDVGVAPEYLSVATKDRSAKMSCSVEGISCTPPPI